MTIQVSTECASDWPNLETIRSMRAVWERDIVRSTLSRLMAIPRANLASPMSEIFHFASRSALKRLFLSDVDATDIMS